MSPMRSLTFTLALLSVVACGDARPLVSAGSSGTDARPYTGAIGSSDRPSDDGGLEEALDGGAALDDGGEPETGARADDGGGATGAPDDGGGAISYDPEALCPATIALGAAALVPSSTTRDDRGLSVTLDGRSAAWTTEDDGVVTVHYVDRASVIDAFGAERTTSGAFRLGRVALQEDGLGLALVDADGLGFSLLTRAERSEAFGAPTAGPFEMLNAQGRGELAPAGERFADPVFTRGDTFLLYTRVGASTSRTFVSTRFQTSAPFAGGAPFAETALGEAGQRRAVTGVSADVRTLFVWDDPTARSRVITLSASGLVSSDVELGPMRDVQPSADCRTFWFTAGGDVFTASTP